MLPQKFIPGQRVRVNKLASDLVPEYVGMLGTIGIGGISAPAHHHGEYFVGIRRDTGAKVIVKLPTHCLECSQFLLSLVEYQRGAFKMRRRNREISRTVVYLDVSQLAATTR